LVLSLEDNGLCAEGGKALAAGLKGNQVITELNVSNNDLGRNSSYIADTSGITAIADAIPDMGALTSLDLSSNDIGSYWDSAKGKRVGTPEGTFVVLVTFCSHVLFCVGPVAIANAIRDMRALLHFDISDNDIGADGLKALVEALKGNQVITSLSIAKNTLSLNSSGDQDMSGVAALAVAIPGMGALTSLNLAANNLGQLVLPGGWSGPNDDGEYEDPDGEDHQQAPAGSKPEGIIALANAIPDMRAILSVNLLQNNIGIDQAKALVSMLKEHPTLTSLCGNKSNETKLDMSSEMSGAGDTIMLVASNMGYSADDLMKAGCSISDLQEAGFSVFDLMKAGYSAGDLKEAGYSAGDLKKAGYSAGDLKKAGYSAFDLKKAGCSAGDLMNAGCSAGDLKEAGYSAFDLKKEGCSAGDLMKAGYSAGDLKKAGCSAGDLMKAGCSAGDLKEAGYSAGDLKRAGYSAGDLKNAGCSAGDLIVVGCSIGDVKKAGYSAFDLKKAGCFIGDLKKAGYSAFDLKKAGCSDYDLKKAGYSTSELAEIGMTPQQIAKQKVFYRGTSCTKGNPTKRSFTTEAGGTLKTNFGVELLVPAGANISGEISVSLVSEDSKKGLMAPPPIGVISVGPLIEVQPHAGRSSSFDKPVTMRLPHSSTSPHCCRVLHCENIGAPWSVIDASFCKPFDNSIVFQVNHFSFFTVVQNQEVPEKVRCRAYRCKDTISNGQTSELKVQLWIVPDSIDRLYAHQQIMADSGFEECGVAEEETDAVQGAGFVALLDGARQSQSWQCQTAQILFEMSLPVTPADAGKKLGWEAEIVRSWATAVQRYSPEQISKFVFAIAAAKEYAVYAEKLLEEGVDGSDFLSLEDDDLKDDYEIEKKIHRKKILKQIADIKDDQKMKLPFAITIPAPALLPLPPTAPTVTSRTQTQCSLKWDGVAGATHYIIEVAIVSKRQLVGGKLPASALDNAFKVVIRDCKKCVITLDQAIFAGFVRVRTAGSSGVSPASIATPLPPKEYDNFKLNKARRRSITLAESEPNYHRTSHSQIDLLPSTESSTTGSHTAMEELDDVARQGQEEAAAARTMRHECECLSARLAALVLGLNYCATGKEPELATVLNHAQRASDLIRCHSDGGWLLLHITLADHAHCFASIDDDLLKTVNGVGHWSQASIAMRAASECSYRPREKIQADFNRQKLLELLLSAFTNAEASSVVLSKEAAAELCRGFRGTDMTELGQEIEILVAGGGVVALRHCDEQQHSGSAFMAEHAKETSLLRSIQQGQQLIQQEGRQRHAELMGELRGMKRLHLDGLEGRDKCPSVFLLTHGNEPAPTFGFNDSKEAAASSLCDTASEEAALENLEMKRLEVQARAVILVRKLEVMAGHESSGTTQKWRLRLFGRPKAPETPRPLEAQDDGAKLAQAVELTTEDYCEWIQGLVDVFQTLFNRAKTIYTAYRESNSANDSDVPIGNRILSNRISCQQIAELLRLGCQIAQDCGHARKDIARWASFLLSTQLLADTGSKCAVHTRSSQERVRQLTQTKVRAALLEAFEWGVLNNGLVEDSAQVLLAQFEVQGEDNDHEGNKEEGRQEGAGAEQYEDEQQCDFMSNFKYNSFRSFSTKTKALGAKLNETYALYDTVKIHLLCECGSDGECHLLDMPPYVVTIPSDRVGKWGPLAGLALRTMGSAVGVTGLPGTSAAKAACGAATKYIDRVSDKRALELFEGKLGEKGRNELLGAALNDFHEYILQELEPKYQKKKGWKQLQGLSPTHVNGQICWLCAKCLQQRRDMDEE
jgi:hypothetical protein